MPEEKPKETPKKTPAKTMPEYLKEISKNKLEIIKKIRAIEEKKGEIIKHIKGLKEELEKIEVKDRLPYLREIGGKEDEELKEEGKELKKLIEYEKAIDELLKHLYLLEMHVRLIIQKLSQEKSNQPEWLQSLTRLNKIIQIIFEHLPKYFRVGKEEIENEEKLEELLGKNYVEKRLSDKWMFIVKQEEEKIINLFEKEIAHFNGILEMMKTENYYINQIANLLEKQQKPTLLPSKEQDKSSERVGIQNIREYANADANNLLDFIRVTSKDYYPPLSEREGGIMGFFRHWTKNKGKAVICERDDKIAGSIGYWHESGYVYVDWISVIDEFKGTPMAVRLLQHAFEIDPLLKEKVIYARTWKENTISQRLMEGVGGKKVEDQDTIRILEQSDPPLKYPGRVTYWYVIDGTECYRRLQRFSHRISEPKQ